jgi:large subunit ribosomal protein L10
VPKTKAQKQKTVERLKETLAKSKSVVFVDIQGLKAKEVLGLRRRVKRAQGKLTVAKKTLLGLSLKEKTTTNFRQMPGEVAALFSLEDELLPLKEAYSFAKEHEALKLLAGIFDNVLLGKDEILALAQLPTKKELLSRLCSTISAPASNFVNVLRGNIKGLICILAKKI